MRATSAAEIFRHNVRMLMDDRGLTQAEVAEAIGTSAPNISRVLAGKEGITFERAERIANYFGYPLSALIADKFVKQTA